jgi:hypothetical protein
LLSLNIISIVQVVDTYIIIKFYYYYSSFIDTVSMRQRYLPQSTVESNYRTVKDVPHIRDGFLEKEEGFTRPMTSRAPSPDMFKSLSHQEQLHYCGRASPQSVTARVVLTPSPDTVAEHRLQFTKRPTSPTFISFGHQTRTAVAPSRPLVEAYKSGFDVHPPLRVVTNSSLVAFRSPVQRSSPPMNRNYYGMYVIIATFYLDSP